MFRRSTPHAALVPPSPLLITAGEDPKPRTTGLLPVPKSHGISTTGRTAQKPLVQARAPDGLQRPLRHPASSPTTRLR